MLDVDTFLTTVYVAVDDYCQTLSPEARPGPPPSLARSEIVTLALFSQWAEFRSERAFYRYAQRHLRGAFPGLPARSQFNRLLRAQHDAITGFGLSLADALGHPTAPCEVLDCSAVPTRNVKRRGAGWLPGIADIGKSSTLGWYEGLALLIAVLPNGAITGFALAPASTKEQPFAEDFLARRACPDARCLSVGHPSTGPYLADNGFVGAERHARWHAAFGATVVCPPQRHEAPQHNWPPALRRWHAGLRQIVETVFAALHDTFRLRRDRPHDLTGLLARLAAKVALHNCCLWLNRQLGRAPLAVADLIDW